MDYRFLHKRVKNLSLISKKLADGIFAGNYRSAFRGPGLEFDEVREYVFGDDVRNIEWNVTSRMNSPYSKKFREEREMNFFFIIDVSASVDYGVGKYPRREMVGLVTSLLSYAAVYNNDRVGAVFFSDRIEKWVASGKGQKQVTRLVNDMMNLNPEGKGSDLGLAVSTVYKSMKRRGICVIISDFKTTSGWKELTLLAKKHDVIAIKVTDPIDYNLDFMGFTRIEDPETGKSSSFFVNSKKFAKKYKLFREDQDYFWKKECSRRGIETLVVDTNDDPVKELMKFFSRRHK
ncbi:MAG: DUF58 domain-containing protein [Spirochaetales bacterium]|nr:DUF58 domain-containing protein [Spirochaetales bacterium]